MSDRFTLRLVVGGLILIILSGLGLAAFAPQGGDVFSDAVKIGLGALAGALPGFISRGAGEPPPTVQLAGEPILTREVDDSVRPADIAQE